MEQNRPAAVSATDNRLTEHAAHQRAATPPAAGTSADSCAFAHLGKSFGAGLNRFGYGAPANLVAKAGRLEVVDHRLFAGLLLQLVDGGSP